MKWYIKTDLQDVVAVKEAIADLITIKTAHGHPGTFDCVESHNEQRLRLEGMINKEFAIKGIGLDELDRLNKKSVMKTMSIVFIP